MFFNFPPIRTTRSIAQQLDKIHEEVIECQKAITSQEEDEEMVDILHAVETALRIHFNGRQDELNRIIKQVFEKNLARGYYERSCF